MQGRNSNPISREEPALSQRAEALREGDEGYTEKGLRYVVVRDPVTGGLIKVVIDVDKL